MRKEKTPDKKSPSYIDIAIPILDYQNKIYNEKVKNPENTKIYDFSIKSINDILKIIKDLF